MNLKGCGWKKLWPNLGRTGKAQRSVCQIQVRSVPAGASLLGGWFSSLLLARWLGTSYWNVLHCVILGSLHHVGSGFVMKTLHDTECCCIIVQRPVLVQCTMKISWGTVELTGLV
jgi:hypothetical protein